MPPQDGNSSGPSTSKRNPNKNNNNTSKKARPPRPAPGHGLAEVVLDEDILLSPNDQYREYKQEHLHGMKYAKTGALKTLLPYRSHPSKKKQKFSPLDYHGLFNFLSLRFLNDIFYHDKANLDPEDLFPHSQWDTSYYNGLRFESMWQEEVDKKGIEKASLGKICLKFVRTRLVFMFTGLFMVTMSLLFVTAYLTQKILVYIDDGERDDVYGIGLALSILAMNLFRVSNGLMFFITSCRTATRLRVGVLSIIFQKVARLRSLKDKSVGEVVNICANDSQRIFDVTIFGNYLATAIILIIAILIVLYFILGWSAVLGTLGTFIIFWPTQAIFGRITTYLRELCIEVTDERVQKMNEVLTYVKLIKMYAWEVPFSKAVSAIRARERGYLEKAGYMQSFSISLTPITPNIATVFTILVHLAFGNELTATKAFTLVATLNTLRAVMGATPWSIRAIAESQVALRRLKSILVMEDMSPLDKLPDNDRFAVLIKGGTFAWDKLEKENDQDVVDERDQVKLRDMNSDKKKVIVSGVSAALVGLDNEEVNDFIRRSDINKKNPYDEELVAPVLFGINLKLEKGKLTGCCGGVGAGKSSLIAAILGQLHTLEGHCVSTGKFAYAAQEAWLFNATLKENILFGKPYDEKKYKRTIYNCCLGPDLAILPYGDQTEIGERGLNLSGGQKQRISLARALYSDRDIYLLDDPLSAVDAHVGKHIFENYIQKGLKGKTVLFMTHQLQYLKNCDVILTLADGRIVESGDHDTLMSHNNVYAGLIRTFHNQKEEEEDLEEAGNALKEKEEEMHERKERALSELSGRSRASSVLSDIVPNVQIDGGKLIKDEVRGTEAVGLETYMAYVRSMGGISMALLVFFFFLLMFFTMTFNNWWLSYWLGQGSGGADGADPEDISQNPQLAFYEGIYGGSLGLIIIFGAIKSAVFMKLTLRASSHMHDTVFVKVFRSPMSFFDTTPTGRVLNRFSKDLDEVDVLLPLNLEISIQNVLVLLFAIIVVCAVFPILLGIAIPCFILFLVIVGYYRRGIRDLKRIENITRSPWFSHITATVSGLATIHAYEKTNDFILRFRELMDGNSLPYMIFRVSARWAGVRLEALAITLQFATTLMVVLSHGNIDSSTAGLALSYTIQFTGMLQILILMASETEARYTSVERIQSYMKTLVSEAPPRIKGRVPKKGWPHQGKVQFKDFSMRYREGLPLVVKGINLTIQPREKIGIVGRTGSGKSSLGIGLFRLVEACGGGIIIDDIMIGEIGLRDLRSRLSIIPQDPVLFYGTVRYNLDPFQEHDDKTLWDALEQSFMKPRISGIDNRLDAMVAEGGDNFSVGERQLLCMARALLRNSKILMLDEATAAIDTKTDSLIQNTIRTAFTHCTMLIIAHRLNTILDADKVLVMDDGNVAEFDSPANLLANEQGVFSGMVNAAKSAAH
ncbi:ATP-binding cassette sub-family C member 5-like [Apostichopus japonicus]|uniref:ATP-binding cassette sub-family C member 5-like n=1 Tax=Stichopus japonicus TaxID=307972 RepID=UPI003AB8CC42